MSGVDIKIPDGESDANLTALIKWANEPSGDRGDQRKHLDMLDTYLGKIRQKEDDNNNAATEKARQAEDRRRRKHQKYGAFSKTVYRIFRSLTIPIKNAFDFVLKVLYGGMKALEATLFIAAELTFQTHYQVAVKAIMLFITV